MRTMNFSGLLLAALLAGCASLPAPFREGPPAITADEANNHYLQGLNLYRENRLEPALTDLDTALSSQTLGKSEATNARKHIAFIHCLSDRERQCRDQFQALLKADPDFDLAANEAGHPMWGPVWRSVKGAAVEKQIVIRASRWHATPEQQKLAEGIKEYEAGRYNEALEALQFALKDLPASADALLAHKYMAFAYCLTRQVRECRAVFRQMFVIEPTFALLPSEAGHPAWARVYRSEKSRAARKLAADKKAAARQASREARKAKPK